MSNKSDLSPGAMIPNGWQMYGNNWCGECGRLHCPECEVPPGETHKPRCSRTGEWTHEDGFPVNLLKKEAP